MVGINNKGDLMGTPNREPQVHGRNVLKCKDPGRYNVWTRVGIFLVYSYYVLGVPCLEFPVKSL